VWGGVEALLHIALNALKRCLLVLVSGVALARIISKALNLDVLAFVAFIPLLFVIEDEGCFQVFLYASSQALISNAMSLKWLVGPRRGQASLDLIAKAVCLSVFAALLALFAGATIAAAVRWSR